MDRNLGMVVMCNDGGIAIQSRRLAQMLRPERILVVDSSGFSRNKEQHLDWYEGFTGYTTSGFPTDREVDVFLKGLTHVYMIENPFNFRLISQASKLGIKSYIATNYEFCDHLKDQNLPLPTKFLMPSYWKLSNMIQRYGDSRVEYLPPPTDPNEFKDARMVNMNRENQKVKLLHIVGTLAAEDRNGTLDLLQALAYTNGDFTLTIKSQHILPDQYMTQDSRVEYKIGNEPQVNDLYTGYDALVLPRRYGGLALTCNEALMSGLPVLMPNISPNTKLLPKEWLFEAHKSHKIMTRTALDVFRSDLKDLARSINYIVDNNSTEIKLQAFELAYDNFSPTVLERKYKQLWV
jgi:hypothetical protein